MYNMFFSVVALESGSDHRIWKPRISQKLSLQICQRSGQPSLLALLARLFGGEPVSCKEMRGNMGIVFCERWILEFYPDVQVQFIAKYR